MSDLPRFNVTPFTTDGGYRDTPRLSPDGDKVAYQWGWAGVPGDTASNPKEWSDIYVKAVAFGARPLRLTDDPAPETLPVWSPDAHEIAFVRESEGRSAIYLVPAMGGQERKLTDVAAASPAGAWTAVGALSWSNDGRCLVFAEADAESGARPRGLERQKDLRRRERRAAREEATLIASTGYDANPTYSPDGRAARRRTLHLGRLTG